MPRARSFVCRHWTANPRQASGTLCDCCRPRPTPEHWHGAARRARFTPGRVVRRGHRIWPYRHAEPCGHCPACVIRLSFRFDARFIRMWKLLRNLVLAAILLAGVLKLLSWYEVGQDAQRITAALSPYAQVHYDGISAGLDGSVNLSGVNVAVKREMAQDVYHADTVALESPGVFWLLKHALLRDNSLPPRFGVSVRGLRLPAMPWLDTQWLNPVTLVPFETLGCGGGAFTAADYSKMGVSAGDARQHIDYRYDADGKTLDLTLILSSPGFASLTLEAETHPFDPNALVALDKLRVDQLSVDYADQGYLQRRNRFCGQRTSIGPGQFAEQHVAAVQALLQQHGIQAGSELVKLYRHLVETGGQASILSLPNSNFVVGTGLTLAPEDLLRQLNVTARYQDTPPVMFRLSFAAPVDAETSAAI